MAHFKHEYVADGFLEDATELLKEFTDLETVEFKEFASIWRKHYFSLIFMGRPDKAETCEFVNEIYRITCEILVKSPFYQQVGAVYLLYGLFETQIPDPIIKIRLTMDHWKIIKSLRDTAILKKYITLHYVIDYLIEHAFLYVAHQTLKGPLTKNIPRTRNCDKEICKPLESYKSEILAFSANNHFVELENLRKEYADLTKKSRFGNELGESIGSYEDAIRELDDLVNFGKEKKNSLGNRRVNLKAESFKRKSENHLQMTSNDDEVVADDVNFEIPDKKSIQFKKQRRTPKEERKVGRPRKKPLKKLPEPKSDDEIDIRHLIRQLDFHNPPNDKKKKIRTKRAPYYDDSPERKHNSGRKTKKRGQYYEDPSERECDSDERTTRGPYYEDPPDDSLANFLE